MSSNLANVIWSFFEISCRGRKPLKYRLIFAIWTENKSACCRVQLVNFWGNDFVSATVRSFPDKCSYCILICNLSGNIGVWISQTLCSWFSSISIKLIPSIEEFAYISPNILFKKECSAWVIRHVLSQIKNHIIKDPKPLTFKNFFFKLFFSHYILEVLSYPFIISTS